MTDLELTRAQLQALAILALGPARQSNATSPRGRTVSWRTVEVLERMGLAIDVARCKAILTDAGRALAADPPAPPPIRHDHGTHACYVLDGCRCLPCSSAAADYERQRTRDNVQGRPRLVDAEPVRAHVRALMASGNGATDGVGLKQIVRVAGVSHGALWKLIYGAPGRGGPSRHVRADTAQRLLAVGPQHMADGASVPAGQTGGRLRQLREAGATWTEIGAQIGMTGRNTAATAARRRVRAGTARAVHDLHRRWQAGQWTPHGPRSRWEAADGR